MKACGAPLWEQEVPLAILSSSNTTIMSNPLPQYVGFVFTHDCVSILDNIAKGACCSTHFCTVQSNNLELSPHRLCKR